MKLTLQEYYPQSLYSPSLEKQAGCVNEVCSAQFIYELIQHDSPDKSKPFGGLF